MSLKSSNKTDVNTTELVITIDPAAFEAAVEKEYPETEERTFRSRASERARSQESLLSVSSVRAHSMRALSILSSVPRSTLLLSRKSSLSLTDPTLK